MRRVYQTGGFREVKDSWVSDHARPRGPRIRRTATKGQMDYNLRTAIREATRILNGNFSYENGDLLCTFTFEQEPEDRESAWKTFSHSFLDRLRRKLKKEKRELRFFAVVSDMDGDTKKDVRIHVHAVLSGLSLDEIRDSWKLGYVDARTIRKEKTHASLARYMLLQCRCGENEKKFHTSRNLERTKLISETEIIGEKKYRMPKGAELICQGEYCPETGKLLDLQILMPRKEKNNAENRRRSHT